MDRVLANDAFKLRYKIAPVGIFSIFFTNQYLLFTIDITAEYKGSISILVSYIKGFG
jgi:hypothetical protein